MRIEHKKFKCIECNTKFDTYAENCLACGANILKSEDIQRKSTYLMLIILSLSSTSTLLYLMENELINILSGVFGLIAILAIYSQAGTTDFLVLNTMEFSERRQILM